MTGRSNFSLKQFSDAREDLSEELKSYEATVENADMETDEASKENRNEEEKETAKADENGEENGAAKESEDAGSMSR